MAPSIEFTTESTGNGSVTLTENPGSNLRFGDTFEAEISSVEDLTDDWEVTRCTYIGNGVVTRDSVMFSGNNNQIIDFDTGTKSIVIQLTPEQSIRNSTNVNITNTLITISNSTVNTHLTLPTAAEWSGNYYLHANGSWAAISNVGGISSPGGLDTYVQYNDAGTLGGSNGFTFDKVTNNVFVANTLTVGNSTVTINSVGFSINTTSTANVYIDATIFSISNATSTANITPDALRIGNSSVNVVVNATAIILANSTTNTSMPIPTAVQYAGAYYLKADGSWSTVSAGVAAPAGGNTHVQYNDSGVTGGIDAFTFDEATNNVFIANTLLVGANVQLSTVKLSIGNSTTNVSANSTAALIPDTLYIGNTSINLVANGTTIKLSNSTSNTLISIPSAANWSATNVFLHANGSWVSVAGGGGGNGVPGGTDTYIQYNDAGAFGGIAGFTFNETTNNVVIANTLTVANVTISNKITANGGVGTAAQVLTSNSLGGVYWAAVAGGDVTKVGTPVDNQVGVWTGSGTIEGTTGFTFNSTTNTVTVGAATINSTNYSHTANNALNLGGLAAAGYANLSVATFTTSVNVGANVQANTTALKVGDSTANVVANSTAIKLANSTVNTQITVPTSAQYGGNYYLHANGQWSTVSAGSAAPAGADTHVQYNDGGVTGGIAGFTFSDTTNNVLIANTLTVANVTISNKITANGALGTAAQVLTSNSGGGIYWAAAAGGGDVTKVGTPVNDQVGVWTGSGTIEGTAGFTFNSTTNNALIGNTLTIGSATINSISYSQTANNATNFAGQGQAYYANVTSPSFSTSVSVGANVVANTTALRVGDSTVNLVANSISLKLANSTVNTQIVVPSAAQYAGAYYLHANGSWATVTAGSAIPAGGDSHVQYNDAGTTAGVAGFTFTDATNNVFIANTLTVGSATINSTNYSHTANDSVHFGGLDPGDYQLTSTLATAVSAMTVDNALNLGGQSPSAYQTVSGLATAIAPMSVNNATNFASQGQAYYANVSSPTFSANISVGANNYMNTTILRVGNAAVNTTIANNSIYIGNSTANATHNATNFVVGAINSTSVGVLVSNSTITIGNSSVNSVINATHFNAIANNALNLGGTAAASYQLNSTLAANVAIMTANNANSLGGTLASAYQLNSTLAANVLNMTANNSTNFAGQGQAYYANISSPNFTASVNVGANVQATTSQIKVANSLSNVTILANQIYIGNSTSNVTANASNFIVGAINATSVGVLLANNLITIGNSSVNATVNSTVFSQTANNATNLGGTIASAYQGTANLSTAVALLTANNATNLGGIASGSYLREDLADQGPITGGATVTVNDLGNLSGTTKTPDPGDRPMQKITNNGAGTIAPGAVVGNYLLYVINTTGAGAITTSGWSNTKGDSFDTTTTSKFLCHASISGDGSLLQIVKYA